jgi:hypothetical protein
MTIMISLVGEQPIPTLLPVRYLQPAKTLLVYTTTTEPVAKRLSGLIAGSELVKTSAYEFGSVLQELRSACASLRGELLFNLTGGTKIMSLAAYALAIERQSDFVYLQSEGHQSLLFRYPPASNNPVLPEPIPALISCDDYLRAHWSGYRTEGFHRDSTGNLSEGGRFEQCIHSALVKEFELLSGIRPEGVGDQIEIDLVIRWENQVGIAEIKLGDVKEESLKKGIDQLATAGRREYLGTYTVKFLITARSVRDKKIRTLAENSNVHIVEMGYNSDRSRLEPQDTANLIRRIKEKLGKTR